jgi:hypothetical protein
MDPIDQRLAALETKIDAMYVTVEKLRKYFLWTGIITVVLFVLPLIGLMFAIPSFLQSYSDLGSIDSISPDTLNAITSY